MKKAIWETAKFIGRYFVLFGIPAALAAIVKEKPEYAVPIGIIFSVIDKFIHHLPNEYRGLVPF